MKFEQNVLTKKVMYRGVEVECPIDHAYVAVDCDGEVFSYEDKPIFMEGYAFWQIDDDCSAECAFIGNTDAMSEEDALQSLEEV